MANWRLGYPDNSFMAMYVVIPQISRPLTQLSKPVNAIGHNAVGARDSPLFFCACIETVIALIPFVLRAYLFIYLLTYANYKLTDSNWLSWKGWRVF